ILEIDRHLRGLDRDAVRGRRGAYDDGRVRRGPPDDLARHIEAVSVSVSEEEEVVSTRRKEDRVVAPLDVDRGPTDESRGLLAAEGRGGGRGGLCGQRDWAGQAVTVLRGVVARERGVGGVLLELRALLLLGLSPLEVGAAREAGEHDEQDGGEADGDDPPE